MLFKGTVMHARHIEDICKDLNYSTINLNNSSETRLFHLDSNSNYIINGSILFRNDNQSTKTKCKTLW